MSVAGEHGAAADDEWSAWLLARRHGGDPRFAELIQGELDRIRDRVLDGARLAEGMTLVDVGTGDGLIAFGAIARVGASLGVVLTDISAPLLEHCRARSGEMGVAAQCTFVEGSAESLDGIDSGTADVVTSRAVLAYVADKGLALQEFDRVLKPGGRISIAEPVMQDQALENVALTAALEAPGDLPQREFLTLMQRWRAAQLPSTDAALRLNPLTNYTERDLVRLARATGFVDIHLELHIDVRPLAVTDWDLFVALAPHPCAPTLGEVLAEQFSTSERDLFEMVMRPLIEAGKWNTIDMIAYLVAVKPLPA